MKSCLLIAALFAATTASAQPSLLLPNNSAGTEMDTPPVLPSAPMVLEPKAAPSDAPRDFVIRKDTEQPAGPKEVDKTDRNRDGRLEGNELLRLQEAPAPSK